jgi:hypothetical protein
MWIKNPRIIEDKGKVFKYLLEMIHWRMHMRLKNNLRAGLEREN